MSSNGFVSFTSPTGTYYTNGALPSATDPDDMVCAYWDDLNPSDGGTIYTYQDLANQRFIVQWNNVPRYGTGGAQQQTFEIILNANGSIVTQYKSVNNVTSSTVGIENANGSVALQVVFNAAYLHDLLAVRFSTAPLVPWLSIAPTGGTTHRRAGESHGHVRRDGARHRRVPGDPPPDDERYRRSRRGRSGHVDGDERD